MSAGAFSDPSVAQSAAGLVLVKVHAEKNPEIWQRFGVRSAPTVLFLDSRGNVVDRLKARDPLSVKRQFDEIVATVR